MISSVRGQVVALGADAAVVEVGGVGLTVQCAPGTLARLRIGDGSRLATSLVVREDSLTLYGFADDDERSMFELVQTASGVGPRVAQAMLATLPPTAIRRAIATRDVTALTRVPGIGRKGAERLILELQDKVGQVRGAAAVGAEPGAVAPVGPWREQVQQALVGLGWSAKEASDAVSAVDPAADEGAAGADVPALLRAALRSLGPR